MAIAELKKWNGIRGDRLTRGVVLKVYPGGRPTPQAARAAASTKNSAAKTVAAAPASPEGQPLIHQVRAGETLWSIARAYQTTVEALRAANSFLLSRQLKGGDQLMIVPPR